MRVRAVGQLRQLLALLRGGSPVTATAGPIALSLEFLQVGADGSPALIQLQEPVQRSHGLSRFMALCLLLGYLWLFLAGAA